MKVKNLGLCDIDNLNYLAEEVLQELRVGGYKYDDEGNYVAHSMTPEERYAKLEEFEMDVQNNNYLEFRENKNLKEFSFSDAFYMDLSLIKEKYLRNVLKKARGMMRKDTMHNLMIVSDEIDDNYLDDLLSIRWRENLKIWIIHWRHKENLATAFLTEDKNQEYSNFEKAKELILSDEILRNSPIPKKIGNSNIWVVKTEFQTEIGNLNYVASEFVKSGVIYRFHNFNKDGEEFHNNHEHSIIGVLQSIMDNPNGFSLEGFESDYSQQEREYLQAVRDKLLILVEKNFI